MGSNPRSLLNEQQIIQKCYDAPNDRLRVDAQYSATLSGALEVAISAPGDTIAISDGTDILQVNPDGSINVNIVSSTPTVPQVIVSTFNTAAAVASGVETSITTYTVPGGKTAKLERLEFGGENIAVYNLYINAVLKHRRRTFFGNSLSESMEFTDSSDIGFNLVAGDAVVLKVLHNRPSSGNFEARIQVHEIN